MKSQVVRYNIHCIVLCTFTALLLHLHSVSNKKLSYRRETARRAVSVETEMSQ